VVYGIPGSVVRAALANKAGARTALSTRAGTSSSTSTSTFGLSRADEGARESPNMNPAMGTGREA